MSATAEAPPALRGVSSLSWEEFKAYFTGVWRQGEHVTFLGTTGSGKTTLAIELLELRSWVVAFGVKPEDETMQRLISEKKWPRIKSWDKRPRIYHGDTSQRLVLWPDYKKIEDKAALQWELDHALRVIFTQGRWTIFADELFYICKKLGLAPLMEEYWTLGRSSGLTVVGGSQRPAFIPLLAYDQATHLFLWRDNDETNLRRLSGLGGVSSALVRRTVPRLPKHVALYLNTRTGEMATIQAPKPGGKS